jgi:hypothetical protein
MLDLLSFSYRILFFLFMGSHFHGNQICIVEKPQAASTVQQMPLRISFTGSTPWL